MGAVVYGAGGTPTVGSLPAPEDYVGGAFLEDLTPEPAQVLLALGPSVAAGMLANVARKAAAAEGDGISHQE